MLNENLKRMRKEKGLSQEDLALRLHVVRQTISKWEKGLSFPDSEMLVKLAEALDTTVGALVGEAVASPTPAALQQSESLLDEGGVEAPSTENVSDQSKKKKRKVMTATVCAAAVLAVSLALVICLSLGLFSAKSPLEKTMEAVFPHISMMQSIVEDGGQISLDFTLGSDLSERIKEEKLLFFADILFDGDARSIHAGMGSDDKQIDLGLLWDDQRVQVFSERLLDGGYSVEIDGLIEALDASVFAPGSGTEYALPQDVYDVLLECFDVPESHKQKMVSVQECEAVMYAMLEAAMQKATVVTEQKNVSLTDKKEKLKLTTMTFDAEALSAATETLWDQWENNQAFYEELSQLVSLYSDTLSDSEEDEAASSNEEMMQQLHDDIQTELKAMIKKWRDYHVELCVTYGVKSGYLVYISVEMLEDVWEGETKSVSKTEIEWTFSSNPGRDPSFTVAAKITAKEEETELLSLSYTKENDRFLLSAKVSPILLGSSMQLDLEGIHTADKRQMTLILDSLKLKADDQILFKLTESSLGITLTCGSCTVESIAPDTNVLSMSAEQLDACFEQIEQEFEKFSRDINQSLSFDMFYRTYELVAQGSLEDSAIYSSAYHMATGQFFAVCGSNELKVYDLTTMTLLKTVETEYPTFSLLSGGEYLVAVSYTTDRPYIKVIDPTTLQVIRVIDIQEWFEVTESVDMDGARIDGNVLVCLANNIYGQKIVLIDLSTGEVITQMEAQFFSRWGIDSENHVILFNGHQGISLYHSLTGEYITTVEGRDLSGTEDVRFNGVAFQIGEDYYDASGKRVKASELAGERRREDREANLERVIYKDSDILVTQEKDKNGISYTMFYAKMGQEENAPLFFKTNSSFAEIYKIGDQTYIARVYGEDALWITFSLKEYVDFEL